MFDIIEPLEHHKNKEYDYKPFYLLMLLCGSIYEFHKKTSISQKNKEEEEEEPAKKNETSLNS